MERIGIIGAGSFGTTLGQVLVDNQNEVLVYGRNEEKISDLNTNHKHPFFENIYLPELIKGTTNLHEVVSYSDILLLALPTKVMRSVLTQIVPFLNSKKLFICVSKGIEPNTMKRMSEVVEEVIPERYLKGFVVLSGPSHAEELILRKITCLVSSSRNEELAIFVQKLFSNSYLRIYTSTDLVGVEYGGAIKNAIAVVSGMATGLGLGENARAALISRGALEIIRVVEIMGGNKQTAFGLTGIGDLIVTASSMNSRNFQAGLRIGNGESVDDVLNTSKMVVEGIGTIQAVHQIAQKYSLYLPIIETAYQVVFENKPVKDGLFELINRELKPE